MSERLTQVTIVEKSVHELLPAEATYEQASQTWYMGCPAEDCGVANLSGHHVSYDEEAKSLTVSPSILCGCGAHYFVEQNQIRWV
jgi:hypothetical protein